MQLLNPGLIVLLVLFGIASKTNDNAFLGLLLPLEDLVGMHAVLAGELGQGELSG